MEPIIINTYIFGFLGHFQRNIKDNMDLDSDEGMTGRQPADDDSTQAQAAAPGASLPSQTQPGHRPQAGDA